MKHSWTTVSVPVDFLAELSELAALEERPKYAIIRRAVNAYREREYGTDVAKVTVLE